MPTINCKGNLIDLNHPKVMGILNLTPDSFYDGGFYTGEKRILQQVERMLTEGATFIDVGAYSSRPGAKHISEEDELSRLMPALASILTRFPEILISVDTFRSGIAQKAVQAGAAMINDISAGQLDEQMLDVVAELQVPYCMMHMPGTPQNMQNSTNYSDVLQEIMHFFTKRIQLARAKGINDLILDVGFGFGKTLEQNYMLLKNLDLFQSLDLPLLIGLSRKSMLYKLLELAPEDALNATSVANTLALTKGANILRVHDVKEAVQCIKIHAIYDNSNYE